MQAETLIFPGVFSTFCELIFVIVPGPGLLGTLFM